MTLLTAFLTALLFILISLQRTYSRYPLKELRRRARDGDEIAKRLLKAAVYENSLRASLWILILLTSALLFWDLSINTPLWFAVTSIATFIYLGYVWLPAARISSLSERLAAFSAPVLEKAVSYLHKPLNFIDRKTAEFRGDKTHTGIYDRQDFLKLIEKQQLTVGNRINKLELGIAAHAIEFGDKKIIDHMTPRRAVKTIPHTEHLGAVVLDELHSSGFSRFPVMGSGNDEVVGTLYLHDLINISASPDVKKVMSKKVYYLHEDQTMHDALQAVIKTNHHMFIVVNGFEEFVGVISSEDVFEALIGRPIMDEFDKYQDMRAVAQRAANKDHQDHQEI